MSELSIQELNASKNVKSMLLNEDSKNIAQAVANIKKRTGINVRLVDGRLVAA